MICLDTSPVIWAVQGTARPGQEPMIARTLEYLRRTREAGETFAIPAPVLLEFLSHYPIVRQPDIRRVVEANFLVPAFDTLAACVAAEIHAERERVRAAAATTGRQAVKFDLAILGTAIACGATELLTNDPHVDSLARDRIRVVLVSDVPLPPPSLPFPEAES